MWSREPLAVSSSMPHPATASSQCPCGAGRTAAPTTCQWSPCCGPTPRPATHCRRPMPNAATSSSRPSAPSVAASGTRTLSSSACRCLRHPSLPRSSKVPRRSLPPSRLRRPRQRLPRSPSPRPTGCRPSWGAGASRSGPTRPRRLPGSCLPSSWVAASSVVAAAAFPSRLRNQRLVRWPLRRQPVPRDCLLSCSPRRTAAPPPPQSPLLPPLRPMPRGPSSRRCPPSASPLPCSRLGGSLQQLLSRRTSRSWAQVTSSAAWRCLSLSWEPREAAAALQGSQRSPPWRRRKGPTRLCEGSRPQVSSAPTLRLC
mmetsp:Transcript_17007/g.47496  ORF Transcript_17007/g.47496 Transcript_17007/m.47496 type:complete len:313 (+) Transcript_17007:1281-2219(+)